MHFQKKPQRTSLCISERESRSYFYESKQLLRCLSKKGPKRSSFPETCWNFFLVKTVQFYSFQFNLVNHSILFRCLMESLKPNYIPFRRQQCQIFFSFVFFFFFFKLIFYRGFQTNSVLCRVKATGFCQMLAQLEAFKK